MPETFDDVDISLGLGEDVLAALGRVDGDEDFELILFSVGKKGPTVSLLVLLLLPVLYLVVWEKATVRDAWAREGLTV